MLVYLRVVVIGVLEGYHFIISSGEYYTRGSAAQKIAPPASLDSSWRGRRLPSFDWVW